MSKMKGLKGEPFTMKNKERPCLVRIDKKLMRVSTKKESKLRNSMILVIGTLFIINHPLIVNAIPSTLTTGGYRVNFNDNDVLLNITKIMKQGDIEEYNFTVTADNASLTLIIEILHQSGRLWGLYIENSTEYFEAKAAGSYANFDKLMDHVSNYTVAHWTGSPAEFVLAFHNSHLHAMPDLTQISTSWS